MAEGTVRTALMHGPNSAYALQAASDVAESIGNNEEALNFALKAVDVDPLDPGMLTNLGGIYWRAGQLEQAGETFQRILELYPDHEGTPGWLSWTLLAQGRPEEALQIAAKEPDETIRMLANALIYYDLGTKFLFLMMTQDTHNFSVASAKSVGNWLSVM